ncbi:hypothetical protein DSO57_1003838 [Entomophthora muscae]|uniref:Uncharacterized protein n=1 Tax=Entomophthora muscae TaxID=34485 RepID=A0ACC2UUX9_9FUNG|nr:hypothetical protein DSO57_1003838 [Entomophthora muscae]
MAYLRRRQLPEGVFFDREGADQVASQAASQVTNNLSQNPLLVPFAANIQKTADGIADQMVQNLARSF